MTEPGIYQHHKGNKYRVIGTAMESTNGRPRKPVVIYVSMTNGSVNVRDEEEFHEVIDRKQCGLHEYLEPDGRCECVFRFKLIEHPEDYKEDPDE